MPLNFTVAFDRDGTDKLLQAMLHAVLQPLVDMVSITEKNRKGRAPQVHDAGAEYLQECMDDRVRCTGNVFPLHSIQLYKHALQSKHRVL